MNRFALALSLALLTLTISAAAGSMDKKDIVDTAVAAGDFKTLAAALQAAGLVDTLKGPGPFTVFAPTDEAFAKLPAGTVENLLKPENHDKLVAILTYHVVPGKVMAKDVVKLHEAKTVNGKDVTIMAEGGKVMVGDANVVKPISPALTVSFTSSTPCFFLSNSLSSRCISLQPAAGDIVPQPHFSLMPLSTPRR